jgi:hypothetical protein
MLALRRLQRVFFNGIGRSSPPTLTLPGSVPAISEKRLSITPAGNVRYQLKTPYRESLPHERSECFGHGTTHVIFEPMDFLARLAALVPKPRVNPGSSPGQALTRFHGVFAANSRFRSEVTPGRRGKPSDPLEKSPEERRRAMNCTRGHKGPTFETSVHQK